jgi:hypothetical protein
MRAKGPALPAGIIEQIDRRDDLARQHRKDAVHLDPICRVNGRQLTKSAFGAGKDRSISGTDLSPYQPSRLPTRGRSTLNCPRHGVLKTCNKAFATEGVLTEC